MIGDASGDRRACVRKGARDAAAPRRSTHAETRCASAGAGEEHERRRAVETRERESCGRGVTGHGKPARCERAFRLEVALPSSTRTLARGCEDAPRRHCYTFAQSRRKASGRRCRRRYARLQNASGRRRRARAAPRGSTTNTGVWRAGRD
jgi:hypothetical protein